jgi:hypothetical protein
MGRGLIGIETIPRTAADSGTQRAARQREADWFMHVDADEIRLPPRTDRSLARAFAEVAGEGYNAVNFQEFTFIPKRRIMITGIFRRRCGGTTRSRRRLPRIG